jgi:hypothetical protein
MLIDGLSFAPIASAENANALLTPSEAYSHHSIADPAEAIITLLLITVSAVLRDDAALVEEGKLSQLEGNAVLFLVESVLRLVPFESRHRRQMVILPYKYMAK